MAKNNKADELLKVLGRQTPTVEPATAVPIHQEPAPAPTRAGKPLVRKTARQPEAPRLKPSQAIRGKAVQFYLHDEDQKLIRELSVWLLPHRKRINDSLVIKTVLRAAKTGPALLAAYDDAIAIDGRSKSHKNKQRL